MGRLKITVLLLGALAVASAGCRGKPQFAPVEGTVTKAGKPLAGVIVEFYSDPDAGTVPLCSRSGPTDEAGHFRLCSDGGEDGAVVGRYRVCLLDMWNLKFSLEQIPKGVTLPKELKEVVFSKKGKAVPRVPSCYGRVNETPLRVEVRPGAQVIDFDVK